MDRALQYSFYLLNDPNFQMEVAIQHLRNTPAWQFTQSHVLLSIVLCFKEGNLGFMALLLEQRRYPVRFEQLVHNLFERACLNRGWNPQEMRQLFRGYMAQQPWIWQPNQIFEGQNLIPQINENIDQQMLLQIEIPDRVMEEVGEQVPEPAVPQNSPILLEENVQAVIPLEVGNDIQMEPETVTIERPSISNSNTDREVPSSSTNRSYESLRSNVPELLPPVKNNENNKTEDDEIVIRKVIDGRINGQCHSEHRMQAELPASQNPEPQISPNPIIEEADRQMHERANEAARLLELARAPFQRAGTPAVGNNISLELVTFMMENSSTPSTSYRRSSEMHSSSSEMELPSTSGAQEPKAVGIQKSGSTAAFSTSCNGNQSRKRTMHPDQEMGLQKKKMVDLEIINGGIGASSSGNVQQDSPQPATAAQKQPQKIQKQASKRSSTKTKKRENMKPWKSSMVTRYTLEEKEKNEEEDAPWRSRQLRQRKPGKNYNEDSDEEEKKWVGRKQAGTNMDRDAPVVGNEVEDQEDQESWEAAGADSNNSGRDEDRARVEEPALINDNFDDINLDVVQALDARLGDRLPILPVLPVLNGEDVRLILADVERENARRPSRPVERAAGNTAVEVLVGESNVREEPQQGREPVVEREENDSASLSRNEENHQGPQEGGAADQAQEWLPPAHEDNAENYARWTVAEMAEWVFRLTGSEDARRRILDGSIDGRSMHLLAADYCGYLGINPVDWNRIKKFANKRITRLRAIVQARRERRARRARRAEEARQRQALEAQQAQEAQARDAPRSLRPRRDRTAQRAQGAPRDLRPRRGEGNRRAL